MRVSLRWTYYKSKIPQTIFTSEEMDGKDAISIANDLEKWGRSQNIIFIDDIGQEWTKKQYLKLMEEIKEEPHQVVLFFDGSHIPGTKKGSAGTAIYFEQNGKTNRLRYNEIFDYIDNNNEAEYCALYAAVRQLDHLGVHHQTITIKGDSHVVIKQLSGEWPCYEENLNKWLDRIEEELQKLGLKFQAIPINRKENTEAHKLAAQAMEGIRINSHMEIQSNGDWVNG